MLGKDLRPERVLQIKRQEEAGFRAVIVDRDAMSSGLLADALIRDLHCHAVGAQSSELLTILDTTKTDVVIVSSDFISKSGGGFELSSAVSAVHPEVPIVVLLDDPTREAVIHAFRSGARGVFNRQEQIAKLLDCVEHVRKGYVWAGGEEAGFLLEALKSIPSPSAFIGDNLAGLTARELEVVQSAAKGNTNKTIAGELGLSEHTVKNYLFRAFDKLGVSSRVELLYFLTVRGHSFKPAMVEKEVPATVD